jgi:hypothetical protein
MLYPEVSRTVVRGLIRVRELLLKSMAIEKMEGKIKGWALVTMTLQVQAQLPVQAAAVQNRCHRKKKQQYLTMCGREITGRKGAMCDATTSSNAVHL